MKKPAGSKRVVPGTKPDRAKPEKTVVNRGWPVALAGSAVLVGGSIVVSAVVNPLFGRFVHWDWMAVLAPTLFLVVAISIRRRWV